MSVASKGSFEPEYLIDLHGVREALTTRTNSARVAVMEAIESGRMLIIRSVSEELKEIFPELYDSFKSIKKRRYEKVLVADQASAGMLMERNGATIFGSIPPPDRFEAIALARRKKLKLVSAGKALSDCQIICSKCGLPSDAAISIVDL